MTPPAVAPELSARGRLSRVVMSLATVLPDTHGVLLADTRFADGREALNRLMSDAHRSAALASVGDDEAAWLADLLHHRWAALEDPELVPFAELQGPDEVRIGQEVALSVAVSGVDPGWTVAWPDSIASDEGHRATVRIPPDASSPYRLSARVMVTGPTRTILVASWQAALVPTVSGKRPVAAPFAGTSHDDGEKPARGQEDP